MTRPLRMRLRLPLAAAFAAALALPPAAASAQRADESSPLPSRAVVPGEVLVRYEAGTSKAERAGAREDAGTRAIEGLGMARAQLLQVTDGDSVAATVRELEADPNVAYAEPNRLRTLTALPDDPEFLNGNQWGLFNDGQTVNGVTGIPDADISATAGWNFTVGELSTVVAVMDTGTDLQHPDLVGNLWANPLEAGGTPGVDDDGNGLIDDVNGWDFIGDTYDETPDSIAPDADPTDLQGHGTHVAGIAAAEGDNSIGVTGVSQRASLMSLRICGTYDNDCPDSALIQAINYAAAEGARVVNGSISGPGSNEAISDALESHPGTLYVFAAGNGGGDGEGDDNDVVPQYPCNADEGTDYGADNVICVAATDQRDRRTDFSNYGEQSVDLGAPGDNVFSTSGMREFFADDFESGDISAAWTNTGASTWAASGEDPKNGSFAISDSPGGPYAANTVNEVVSNPVTLDGGYSSCEIRYDRAIELASGDTFQITGLLDTDTPPDGVPDASDSTFPPFTAADNTGGEFLSRSFSLDPDFDAGGQLQVRFRLTSANDATQADGVHMDDVSVVCAGSPSDNGNEFMNGTSMAAPMVTGAAGLLFSADAGTTAADVKDKLLTSVDSVPDLAGSTVSGGRLNVYGALTTGGTDPSGGGGGGGTPPASPAPPATGSAVNMRPDTFFRRQPGRVVRTTKSRARVVFRFGATEAGTTFRCKLNGSGYRFCSSRFVRRLRPGPYVLKVKAVDSQGAIDASAAVRRFRVKRVED